MIVSSLYIIWYFYDNQKRVCFSISLIFQCNHNYGNCFSSKCNVKRTFTPVVWFSMVANAFSLIGNCEMDAIKSVFFSFKSKHKNILTIHILYVAFNSHPMQHCFVLFAFFLLAQQLFQQQAKKLSYFYFVATYIFTIHFLIYSVSLIIVTSHLNVW